MTRSILFYDVVSPDYLDLAAQVAELGYQVVFNGGPLFNLAAKQRQNVATWDRLATPELLAKSHRAASQAFNSLKDALETPRGLAHWNTATGIATNQAAFLQIVHDLAVQQIIAIEMTESLRRQTSLQAIVLGCDNSPTQRAIVLFARKHGIPTLQLAHAIYGHSHALARPAGELHTLYSDRIAVFGARAKRDAVAAGIPEDRILLTGAPHWDSLYRPEAQIDRTEACHQIGLDPNRPVVLYCGGYADGSSAFYTAMVRWFDRTMRAVIKACAAIGPEVQLVVRPHPHERSRYPTSDAQFAQITDRLKSWSKELCHPIASISTGNKIASFRAASVAIAPASSSVIPELIILQRPVVGIPFFNEAGLLYDESDGVAIARSDSEIAASLHRVLRDEDYRREVTQLQRNVVTDLNIAAGNASIRTAQAIHELAAAATCTRPRPNFPRPGCLRILMAVHDFFPFGKGGTERYTRDLSHALVQRGHQVHILHPRPILKEPGRCILEEVEVDGLPITRLLIPANEYTRPHLEQIRPILTGFLERHPVDLIHAQHLMGLGVSIIDTAHDRGIPFVFTANDFWPICDQIHLMHPSGSVCSGPETIEKCVQCAQQRFQLSKEHQPRIFQILSNRQQVIQQAFSKIDLMLSPSNFLMHTLSRYGISPQRTAHLPQGAKLAIPTPQATTHNDRQPAKTPGAMTVAYLGHIAYRKGLDILVRALNDLPQDQVELHIHGINAEPEYFDRCMQLATPSLRWQFHGPYDLAEMPDRLANCDVAVVPSRGENYPFVIREILHLRVPVVASDVAGIPEIVQDGINGRLFRSESATDLSRVLRELHNDPQQLASLRANIRPIKSIEEDAADIEAHYRSLVAAVPRQTIGNTNLQTSPASVQIVLVAPNDQSPTLAHAEIGAMLAAEFAQLGVATQFQRNRIQPGAINLVIGFDRIENLDPIAQIPKVALQLEPLGDRENGTVQKLRNANEVWSFHENDVSWLQSQNIPARHIPFAFFQKLNDSKNPSPDIDILFEGTPDSRQKRIIEELRTFSQVTCFSGAFGSQRDSLYARAKIILHLHSNESEKLDLARILYQIHRGWFVLAEAPQNALPLSVSNATRSQLASECKKYLANDAERNRAVEDGLRWLRKRPISANLLSMLEGVASKAVSPHSDPVAQQQEVHR